MVLHPLVLILDAEVELEFLFEQGGGVVTGIVEVYGSWSSPISLQRIAAVELLNPLHTLLSFRSISRGHPGPRPRPKEGPLLHFESVISRHSFLHVIVEGLVLIVDLNSIEFVISGTIVTLSAPLPLRFNFAATKSVTLFDLTSLFSSRGRHTHFLDATLTSSQLFIVGVTFYEHVALDELGGVNKGVARGGDSARYVGWGGEGARGIGEGWDATWYESHLILLFNFICQLRPELVPLTLDFELLLGGAHPFDVARVAHEVYYDLAGGFVVFLLNTHHLTHPRHFLRNRCFKIRVPGHSILFLKNGPDLFVL